MSNCRQCIIKRFNALKTLTNEELETFSDHKTSLIIKKGENLMTEGNTINGLYCIRDGKGCKYTEPRALISDLNTIPFPAYHLFETDVYFRYSSFPLSVESFNSKCTQTTVIASLKQTF